MTAEGRHIGTEATHQRCLFISMCSSMRKLIFEVRREGKGEAQQALGESNLVSDQCLKFSGYLRLSKFPITG